jgi:hypothetical protein
MRLTRRQWIILGAVLTPASAIGIIAALNWDGLTAMEYECRDALLGSEAMIAVTDFRIERHLNWWEKTYTLSWVLLGAESKPYQNPLVEFLVNFKRQDGLPHKASVRCQFAIVPNSGEPPQVRFDSVRIQWEMFADPEHHRWEPWFRNRAATRN